jgi:hypothetical protein
MVGVVADAGADVVHIPYMAFFVVAEHLEGSVQHAGVQVG